MDNNPTPTVADAVRATIDETFPSLNKAAEGTGLAFSTLHRNLNFNDGEDFRVSQLRRIAKSAGKDIRDFFVEEES